MKHLVTIPDTTSKTSGSLVDEYLIAKENILAGSTFKIASHLLRRFSVDIQPCLAENMTYSGIEDWHSSLTRRRFSVGTVYQHLARAKALYTWGVKTNRIEKSPFIGYDMPYPPNTITHRFYTRQTRDTLFLAAAGTELETILQLGFYAGLRYSEIDAAEWDWIGAGGINVRATETWKPKTVSSTRTVPLNSALSAHLQRIPRIGKYISHPDRPYKPEARYRWDTYRHLKALAVDHNLTPLTSHMMRRTFATLHAMAGTPITNIARWLGDDIKTTYNHYVGYTIDQKQIDAIC